MITNALKSEEYIDLHEWVFTAGSFRVLMGDLYELGYIDLVESYFYFDPEESCEFYISFKKAVRKKDGDPLDWDKMGALRRFRLQEDASFYSSCILKKKTELSEIGVKDIGVKGALVIWAKKHFHGPLYHMARWINRHLLRW